MKPRAGILALALALGGAFPAAQALEISGTAPRLNLKAELPPTIKAGLPPQYRDDIESRVNAGLAIAFDQILAEAREELRGFGRQQALAKGFANANAYSIHSASLRGMPDYDHFALASGILVGVQAPSTDPGYYERIRDEITEQGDIYVGLGMGFSFLNVGIHADFVAPGLYFNAKYGALDQELGDFAFRFTVLGLGASFLVVDPESGAGWARWNGIAIGSGFYVQRNQAETRIEGERIGRTLPVRQEVLEAAPEAERGEYAAILDEIGFTPENPDVEMAMTPAFDLRVDVSTLTIPFDLNTAVSFLWDVIRVQAGAGVDLNSGSGEVAIQGSADVTTRSPDPARYEFTDAEVTLEGQGENEPSFARLRFMTGLGLGLGPVKLDVPLIYYPASGMAFGFTAAVVL